MIKNNPIANYVKWVINQLHELPKNSSQNFIYKITSKEQCKKSGNEIIIVQVVGKNVFLKLSPLDIVRDDAMLKGFSSFDVRTITYMACNTIKEKKSLFNIVAQYFSKSRDEEIFALQGGNDTVQIIKSAQEISSDPELINRFNAQDAHRIGYVAGVEQVILENQFLKHDKEINSSK